MNRQSRRSAETRRRIVEAAFAAIAEAGYSGATVREIATRAGVSQGGLFRHFATRAGLIVATVEHLHHRQVEAIRDILRQRPPGDDSWLAAVRDLAHRPENLVWFEVLVAARKDPDLRARVRDLIRRQDEAMEAISLKVPAFQGLDDRSRRVWVHIARRTVQGGAIMELGKHGRPQLPPLEALIALLDHLAAD